MNPPWIPRIWSLDSPLGPLLVATSDTGLCRLHFSRDASSRSQMAHELMEAGLELSSLANVSDRRVDRQLRDYFQQRRKTFDLPLDLRLATPFGRDHVLPSLCHVPFGVTVSYAELARRAGRPGGARAVGQAVRRNPLPIVIPCHRVISSNGSLGGFSPNLALKRRLLAHEGVTPKSQRLP